MALPPYSPYIVVWSREESRHNRVNSTLAIKMRRGLLEEESQTELIEQCRNRLHTWLFLIGVDVRGFCSQSVCRLLVAVGTNGRDSAKLFRD